MSAKKVLLPLLLFFICLHTLSAQLSFGVQGGATMSTLRYSTDRLELLRTPQARVSYFAGLGITYKLKHAKRISVGLDAQYALREVGFPALDPAFNINVRRSNLDLIPNLSVSILKNLELQAGLYYSFLLRNQIQQNSSSGWQESNGYYADTDFGLSPGLRFHIGRWFVAASGQLGLKNLLRIEFTDENGQPLESTQKNRALQVGIGYRIR